MVPVNMPVVGQDIPTGIVKEWLKEEGERVSKEEIIATVESEKATFDVEAPSDGIIVKIVRQEDEEVEVLTPIAYIGAEGETFKEEEKQEIAEEVDPVKEATIEPKTVMQAVEKNGRFFISPLAKKIAEKEGIEIAVIKGTGPGGRIIKRNVLEAIRFRAAKTQVSKPVSSEIVRQPEVTFLVSEGEKEVPFDRMRQIIADRLSLSKQTIPHFYLFSDVEMDRSLEIKNQLKEKNIRITITDMVVHAVAKAMGEFPRMNSHVYANSYVLLRDINIGLAVSSDDGLRVPVVTHADKDDLSGLSERTKKLSSDARKGKIDPGQKAGLTISTLGMYGISRFLPIINPPESAIFAVGQCAPLVVTDGTSISIKNKMTITLACDHRLIDGAYGAQFMERVKEILEQADFKKLNW